MYSLQSAFGMFIGVLSLVLGMASLAQDEAPSCPTIVQDAVAALDELCADTGRNQACYGNLHLVAEPQPDVTGLQFEQPGDIEDVDHILSLTLSPMDEDVPEWGVALLKLQANLPDMLPGQNVTILLFGDVTLTNVVAPDSEGQSPMQAFYFRSGVGDPQCAEAPESGLLVQTPEGINTVSLTINGVDITLGSTAFLQAQPEDFLYVYLLEGEATVTAFDKEQTVGSGEYTTVPLDPALEAAGTPDTPQVYTDETVAALSPLVESVAAITEATPEATAEATAETEGGVDTGCVITASGNVNLRSGPGTGYSLVGQLLAGGNTFPNGQAVGTDSLIWWRLPEDTWVRSDVVEATAECANLPVIAPADLPPTATPPVETGGGNFSVVTLGPGGCDPTEIPAGSVTFMYGNGGYASCAEANAVLGGTMATLAINGQLLGSSLRGCVQGTTAYIDTVANAVLTAGVYTLSGDWAVGNGGARSCTLTVH